MPEALLKKAETVTSLARRNGVTTDYINKLIAEGMKVEAEHSKDTHVQRIIATQHLSENLGYYKALAKMEKSLDKKSFAAGGNIKSQLSSTPAGGAIVAEQNGKTITTDDGSKGGIFIGRRHSQDGIKGVVDGGSPVEVETDEALIIPEAANNKATVELDGKKMSTKQALSKINQEGGGVPIKKQGGELSENGQPQSAGNGLKLKGESVIITRDAVLDDKKREFNGEMLTNRQILSRINVAGGGAAFEEGGEIPAEICCGGGQFSYGGKMLYGREIAKDMNDSCGCKHSKMEEGGKTGPGESFTKGEVMDALEAVKPKLEGFHALAFKTKSPWRLLKYIQEQATGTTDLTDEVKETNAYNQIVKMVGDEELVKKCIALLPAHKKEKIKEYFIEIGDQVPAGLLEALDMEAKDKGLELSSVDKLILSNVYSAEIDGQHGVISYLGTSRAAEHYAENRVSIPDAMADSKEKINELKASITFMYDNGHLDIDSKYDASRFLQKLNDLVRTHRGRELFDDENPNGKKYYNAYINLYDRLEEYFTGQFGELEYESGGKVAAGSGEKAMRELKSDFLFMVGLVRDEQEGKPSMGWDLSLFKSSFYNKLAKLHKQGKNDQLKIIFDYMAEIENHFKLQKPVFTGKHKIWKLKPQENLEPDTSGKEYPNRPLRASDIPDELKVWIPDMQLKSMIGNDELWEVIDRLTQIVNKMPSTYQTENTPENDKIVYLHYFYGGHDWYIIEKDKGSDKDPDHLKGKQLQTFGYAILNQDYEMGEWGYISIEELNQAKWVELDFWFKPVKFGELKKKWQQSEQEEEQAPQREKIVPRPGTFLYGANWALDEGPVPAEYSTMLLTELRNKGFGIVKLNGESVELMKEGRPKFVLNDNGGEFNLFDDKTRNHITDIPYSINAHGRDFYPVEPDEIADSVDEAYEDYYTKTVDTEEQKPQNPKIKLSGNMRTMDMDQSKRLNIYFADQLTNVFDQMEEDDQLPIGFQYFNDLSSVMIHLEGFNFNIFDNSRKNANPENTYSIFFMTREGLKHEEIAVLNKSDFIKYDQLDGIGLAKAIIEKITTWIKKEKEFETGADQVYEPESHITQENPSSKQVAAAPDKYSEAEATATESLVQMYKGKKQSVINAAIQALLKKKGIDRNQYSADELAFIKLYEGAGGLSKEGVMSTGLLDQFYTPMDICAKMWGLALKNGFKFPGSNILEPAVGSGRFLQFIPADSDANVVAYDIDQTAYTLCKVLFPSFDIRHGSFEEMFFKGKRHIGLAGVAELFDLVIGNPPYREYVSPWAPLGEKEATGAFTFEMYFIGRGVDVLKPGGLLVMIVPNTFMSNDKKYNAFKEKLIQKADLVDGFRLPNGVFGNTEVGTDILVFRKK